MNQPITPGAGDEEASNLEHAAVRGETIAETGELRLRKLLESDIPLMSRWLSDPRVLEFYAGRDRPHDEDMIREHYWAPDRLDVIQCIVEWGGSPIGYQQFYPSEVSEKVPHGYQPEDDVWGMDQFIGYPELWNQGIGTILVRLVATHLDAQAPDRVITTDPLVANPRAIRCYEKAGFQRVRLLPRHELHEGAWRDGWLMVFRSGAKTDADAKGGKMHIDGRR